MSNVGKAAKLPAEENKFIPLAYDPSDNDVKFVGAMGYASFCHLLALNGMHLW